MLRVIILATVLGLWMQALWMQAIAQEQPAVNCATVEQCRVLVMVARGQLFSAQDAWAFWADKAQKLQGQLEKLQKATDEKTEENKDAPRQ